MQRIIIRAPACSADSITHLKGVFRMHAEELPPGERAELLFDAERFPFATAIFESLLASAGFRVLRASEENGARIFEVERV